MGNHQDKVWKQLYKAAEEDTKSVSKETLEKLSTGELNAKDEASIKAFSRKKQEELAVKNKEIIEKLWHEYDVDKDGSLSPEECKKLTKDSITQAKKYMPQMLQSVTNEQLNVVKQSMPPEVQKSFDKIMQKVSKLISEGITLSLNKLLDDSDSLSEEIYLKMDDNKDGRVSKDEFMKNYHTVSSQLINNEEMIQQLQNSVMICVQEELKTRL